jgi:hypothetical protein
MRKQENDVHEIRPPVEERQADALPELATEELEPVVATGHTWNHNETLLPAAGLGAEELEPVITPGLRFNHNETFLAAARL